VELMFVYSLVQYLPCGDTLYQGNNEKNHMFCNIVSTPYVSVATYKRKVNNGNIVIIYFIVRKEDTVPRVPIG
jgi:hypothetical protein